MLTTQTRRCPNYIFILDLTPDFNDCTETSARRDGRHLSFVTYVRFMLETLWQLQPIVWACIRGVAKEMKQRSYVWQNTIQIDSVHRKIHLEWRYVCRYTCSIHFHTYAFYYIIRYFVILAHNINNVTCDKRGLCGTGSMRKVTANALMPKAYQYVSILTHDNSTVMKINTSQRKVYVLVETLLATAVDCWYHVM